MVGYEDGTLRLWDLKQGNTIHVIKGKCQKVCFNYSEIIYITFE